MKYQLTSSTWDQAEIDAIQEVINSGQYSMSNKVAEFEKKFAKDFGSKFAVMVNSGSSANLIMIGALFFKKNNPLKAGDEIIVPAVSWATTYAPLQQYGLHVKFVDIDLETLNFDLEALQKAISPKTKAIFAVNLLGNPNDFTAINKMISGKDIILIEDNCESLGATFENKQAGTFGVMGSFSSFHSHHIVTMEGGVVVTDDEELYHILLSLRAHGWTRNLPEKNQLCVKSDDDFEEKFRFLIPGYNVRPIEMAGATGITQLDKLPKMIEVRRENAKLFQELMANNKNFIIQKELGKSSWFGFAIIIKEESNLSRKKVLEILNKADIETRPIVAGNIAKKEMISKYFDYSLAGEMKNAEIIDQRGFYVGNHSNNIKEQIRYLVQVLNEIK